MFFLPLTVAANWFSCKNDDGYSYLNRLSDSTMTSSNTHSTSFSCGASRNHVAFRLSLALLVLVASMMVDTSDAIDLMKLLDQKQRSIKRAGKYLLSFISQSTFFDLNDATTPNFNVDTFVFLLLSLLTMASDGRGFSHWFRQLVIASLASHLIFHQ